MKLLLAISLSVLPLLQIFYPSSHAAAREVRVADRVFLVRGKPGAPTEFRMIVNAGSADEPGGVSRGLAHYLEHLILNGRNSHNGDVAMRFFPDGRSNGWTNQRATVYTHSVPARPSGPGGDLEKLFGYYARQLQSAEYAPQMAKRERNVVLQEHDWRYGDAPARAFMRKIDGVLYRGHPFAHWTIGQRKSIAALTVHDAKKFHDTWYRINNVWFVIKADITPDRLKKIAATYLNKLQPGRIPARQYNASPDITPADNFVSDSNEKVKQVGVYYSKLVKFGGQGIEQGYASAKVLQRIINTQLPGSLYYALAEEQELTHASPRFWLAQVTANIYRVSVRAMPAKGIAPRKMLSAIEQYIAKLGKPTFSDKTIKRIKARYAAGYKLHFANELSIYHTLVSWLSSGRDYGGLNRLPELIQTTSRKDLQNLGVALAGPGRVVTGILLPGRSASGQFVGGK